MNKINTSDTKKNKEESKRDLQKNKRICWEKKLRDREDYIVNKDIKKNKVLDARNAYVYRSKEGSVFTR